ncbi:hypothetical protein TNCV_4919671 [Trichonephila clavipes]|nr:hypothetical protein TNCV_4919671 [Trichonephila clavipes]
MENHLGAHLAQKTEKQTFVYYPDDLYLTAECGLFRNHYYDQNFLKSLVAESPFWSNSYTHKARSRDLKSSSLTSNRV